MKDYLLLIKSDGDHLDNLTPDQQKQHVQEIGAYIQDYMQKGIMKGAEPLETGGRVVTGVNGTIKDGPFTETKEVISGYFIVSANSLEEATEIAKANPFFQLDNGSIEVRPIKKMEGIN